MKKIYIAMLLSILCIAVSAQTTLVTDQFRTGRWDAVQEKFNYTEWKYATITFTATATGMTADDIVNSVYTFTSPKRTRTSKSEGVAYTTITWDCYDEKYRDCSISITAYANGTGKVSVYYDNSNTVLNYMITKR
jgi:hypothetical protein